MTDLVPVRRALISVSDKTGLAELAGALVRGFGVELISTGGTAAFLRDQGLAVTDVSAVTHFPEMMDGRVKTLHPAIHGGLLAVRDNPQHAQAMREHDIRPIDLVCINLYPFEQTVATPGVAFEHAIENIDIGGPSMVRSAAKNHRFVTVVTAPGQYAAVLEDLRRNQGHSSAALRLAQARQAFELTARYDTAIASYLQGVTGTPADPLESAELSLRLVRRQTLRYGENPHQRAALFVTEPPTRQATAARARQLHGKELSYINLLDADAALAAVKELSVPAVCIVKHATPCGYATADDLPAAFQAAYQGDPLAAFGGIVALNQPVDVPTAEALTAIDKLLEVIVAPAYAPEALELLKTRWKNVRLLEVGPIHAADPNELMMHKIAGGFLVQERDGVGVIENEWKVVSRRPPSAAEWADLKVAWLACKHVKSNAITLAKGRAVVGLGGGQVDRVNAARNAVAKAGERARGAVAASDAFFPFPDGPRLLLDAGVTAIVHPGGALRDQETLEVVDAAGAVLVLTGRRHFRH